MLGLGVIFLIALGLMAAKGKTSPMAPGAPGAAMPLGVPGIATMPIELRQRIADCLKALTVGNDGKIAGPVTAEAIRTATALAGELERLGFKEAGASLRAYAKAASSLLPPVPAAQQIPLPPSIPKELRDRLNKALNTERDPKVLEEIKKALQALPPSPETKQAIELIDNMIMQLKIAAQNQAAASAINQIISSPTPIPPGSPALNIPPAPVPVVIPAPAPAVISPTATVATYKVLSGDTGEKIALKFVGDKNRWRDLLTTNPKLADSTYGIKLFAGQTIVIPTAKGWPWVPSGVPVVVAPTAPAPVVAPFGAATYKVIRGDTGEKIAYKFVGDKNRWRDLLTVNPTLADPTYGIKLFEGKIINIPTAKGWPAIPGTVAPLSPLPSSPPPVIAPIVAPAVPMSPVEAAADAMVKNLKAVQANFGMPGAKGKEDKTLVTRFQNLSGQASPDGKAGPGTLASAAEWMSDMPLVMYWPTSATATKVLEYRTALNNWAAKAEARGDTLRAANLRASALRERGQAGIVGPMPA